MPFAEYRVRSRTFLITTTCVGRISEASSDNPDLIGSLHALRVAIAYSDNLMITINFRRAHKRSVIRRYWLDWEA
jgi:hypothetical protein